MAVLLALSLGAAQSASAGDPVVNPYSPAYGHPYRHGVIPTLSVQQQMQQWAATHWVYTPAAAATGPETLSYGGGTTSGDDASGVGVMPGRVKVYLVFYGTQWGTQGTDANGNLTFSGDPDGAAPVVQMMFKGIGTGNELWSADLTQWCDGPNVVSGATSCTAAALSREVPYELGGVLAGAWYDNTVASPSAATGAQLAQEAIKAAQHFGNTTAASNRYAYYVILSPTGTNPDNYQSPTQGYCAWHDWNGDTSLSGGAVSSPVGDLAFSNQPYNIDVGSSCGVGFLNSPGTLDGWTMTLGHEWHEMMSDTFPAGGWTNQTGNRTYNGQENSDECAWISSGSPGGAANVTMGNGTYAEQASWSNDTNACAITHRIVDAGAPAANFTFTTGSLKASFTDTSTDPPVQAGDTSMISAWAWDFGDGSGRSAAQNPSYTYATAGTYNVTLTVTDRQSGNTSSKTEAVAVGGTPTANFSYVANGLAVNFTDGSTDSGGTIGSYSWNFGDGTGASTQKSPSYTYAAAGTYSVSETVTDSVNNQANTAIKKVTVTAPPTYTVGGTISGLSGSVGLTLAGTNPTSTQTQAFTTNGNFAFTTQLASGSNWTVTVSAQPTGQTCAVANGSGSNLSADMTNVAVTCTTNTYTLTYTAGANGSISGTSPQTVNYGASGTAVTAVPGTGYHFVRWSDGSTANPRTDSNVTANVSVTASFSLTDYTVTASASGGNGTITPASQTVTVGSTATFTVTPNSGYHVASVTGDNCTVTQQGSTTTWTSNPITQNCAVTATFAINVYTVTGSSNGNGSITPTFVKINSGSTVPFNVAPSTGYHAASVTGDNCTVTQQGSTTTWTSSPITQNCAVTATFAINTYTLTYSAGANGSISGTSPQTVNYGASGTAVTAVPGTGYHFVQWSDGSTANPRTDSNVTANLSVTATFAINTYTLTYTAGANGSISGSSAQTVSYGASGTAVTAVPGTGYHFVQWSDGSTANPRTDSNVTANINVTASFAIDSYTLTYTTGANGSISGTSPQTVNYGASGTAVTAVPNTRYHFVRWSDGSTANPRTDSNVTKTLSVTADFATNVLMFTTQPANVSQGDGLGTVVVSEQDGSGHTMPVSGTVDFTITACGGNVNLGSVAMSNGVATLTSVQRFYMLANGHAIAAALAGSAQNATSSSFDVVTNRGFIFSDGFDGCRL